ncbi:MAG: hypothetical protein QXS17_01495 [Candidatus Micrarchaeaceae archaeon]
MSNVLSDSLETYLKHIKLVLLFSIPFLISFIIPVIAPLPSYVASGAIFLRTSGIFVNANPITLAVIIIALFFALLFLSFSFVAISLIVKSAKTHTAITKAVIMNSEKYTGKVFVVLLFYLFLLVLADAIGYYLGIAGALTALVGFFAFMALFFAPTAIVIDNKRIGVALRDSAKLSFSMPQYFLLWLVLIVLVVSVLDFLLIHALGNVYSAYALLIINSLFVVPYFVIYQAHAYMKKFPMLRR